jgi:hypothetical protein
MKEAYLLYVIAILVSYQVSAQSGKKGGKGAGQTKDASSASPTPDAGKGSSAQSGSTEIEQGFHYRFRKLSHLRYASTKSVVEQIRKTKTKPDKVFVQTITQKRRFIINKQTFESLRMKYKDAFSYNLKGDISWSNDTICDYVDFDNTNSSMVIPNCDKDKIMYCDFLRITTKVDSLDRYFNKLLWISVAQGDSGILKPSFFRPLNQTEIPEQYIMAAIVKAEHRNPNKFSMLMLSESPLSSGATGTDIPEKNVDIHVKKFKGDSTVRFAIPIDILQDSVSNFYLRVKPINFFNDPVIAIKIHYSAIQAGILTIPFKYQFGGKSYYTKTNRLDTVPNDVSTNINVGLCVGWRYGATKFYYDQNKTHNNISQMLGVFFAPTLIALNSSNTFDSTSKSSNQLGFSIGAGYLFELKTINFGFFGGIDLPTHSARNWFYSKRIWFGFGLGVNLAMFTQGKFQAM